MSNVWTTEQQKGIGDPSSGYDDSDANELLTDGGGGGGGGTEKE
jgi:hypothetical protein